MYFRTLFSLFIHYISGIFLIFLFSYIFYSCKADFKNEEAKGISSDIKTQSITCESNLCYGKYEGPEFIGGSDIAHQFSNHMSKKVGDHLKNLYNLGKYSIVDFDNIKMSTAGMGSGKVFYELSIPFIQVDHPCDAFTSFDHVGGWGHTPALKKRKRELSGLLLSGDKLNISALKTTKEGLQEYWIQWRHKNIQKRCVSL